MADPRSKSRIEIPGVTASWREAFARCQMALKQVDALIKDYPHEKNKQEEWKKWHAQLIQTRIDINQSIQKMNLIYQFQQDAKALAEKSTHDDVKQRKSSLTKERRKEAEGWLEEVQKNVVYYENEFKTAHQNFVNEMANFSRILQPIEERVEQQRSHQEKMFGEVQDEIAPIPSRFKRASVEIAPAALASLPSIFLNVDELKNNITPLQRNVSQNNEEKEVESRPRGLMR